MFTLIISFGAKRIECFSSSRLVFLLWLVNSLSWFSSALFPYVDSMQMDMESYLHEWPHLENKELL